MLTTNFPRGGGKKVSSINGQSGDVVVGGVNLLKNSTFNDGMSYFNSIRGSSEITTIDDLRVLKYTSSNINGEHYVDQRIDRRADIGNMFSASVWAYAEEKIDVFISIDAPLGSAGTLVVRVSKEIDDKWTKITCSGTAPESFDQIRIFFGINGFQNYNKTVYFYHPVLMRGSIPTDWSPAPEDAITAIDALTARVTALEERIK